MQQSFKVFLIMLVLLLVTMGGFAIAPVPSGNLPKPSPKALAKCKRTGGCGCGTLDHYSSSTSYQANLDDKLLKEFDDELIADGFTKKETAKSIRYRKRIPGLLWTYSYVVILKKGEVVCGASRYKYPH